jgi:hypothetical protein
MSGLTCGRSERWPRSMMSATGLATSLDSWSAAACLRKRSFTSAAVSEPTAPDRRTTKALGLNTNWRPPRQKGQHERTLPRLSPDLRALLWPWLRQNRHRPPRLAGMHRRGQQLDPGQSAAGKRLEESQPQHHAPKRRRHAGHPVL